MIDLTVRQQLVGLHLDLRVIRPTASSNVIFDHLIILKKKILLTVCFNTNFFINEMYWAIHYKIDLWRNHNKIHWRM